MRNTYYVAEITATHTTIKCHQAPTYRLRLRNHLAHYVVNSAEPLPKAAQRVKLPNGEWEQFTSCELTNLRGMRKILKEVAV